MQIVIDIPEDVYTRLFDNGIQDNEIAVDDVCEMARALRRGTPLEKHDEEVIKETVESIWGKPPYTEVLDKIRAEIEQLTSRYSISKERGGMGQVEWSDRLIKESDVSQIIDKYKAERSGEE